MKLWLCRHAAVLLPSGICYGASDVPADEAATAQAAAQCLAVLPNDFLLWSSPLGRTRQLTEALLRLRPTLTKEPKTPANAAQTNPEQPHTPSVHWDVRLQEMNFGGWELRAWDDIGQNAVDAWVADFAYHRVGQLEASRPAQAQGQTPPSTQLASKAESVKGESVNDLLSRVAQALNDAQQQAQTLGASDMVWVTHAGVIRAVQYLLQSPHSQVLSAATWPVHAPAPGGYCVVELVCDQATSASDSG